MAKLHELKIADNTLVFLTSDNGQDSLAFSHMRFNHFRTTTLRGLKSGNHEGSTRIPFLSWWPLGTHKSLYGTNFDLPVTHVDYFATFADILNYPLPKGDKCVYGFDEKTAPEGADASSLGRKVKGRVGKTHKLKFHCL